MITRRETTKLLLGSAAAAAVPGALAAASQDDWVRALQARLEQAAPQGCGTRLTLQRFGFKKQGRNSGMSAVVRMDWAPGFRTRRFDASAGGDEETFRALVGDILGEFARANPDCIA